MKNEQTKKEYSTPEMEIVELKHGANLLQCSENPDAIGCNGMVGN